MMQLPEHIIAILTRFAAGDPLSPSELEELAAWRAQSSHNETLANDLNDAGFIREGLQRRIMAEAARENGWQQLSGAIRPVTPVRSIRRWGWAAAAAVLLAVGGAYIWHQRPQQETVRTIVAADVPPGREGAVLTLSDGTQVALDSTTNGLVASQSGVRVVMRNGRLTYDAHGKAASNIVYNTMRTPKGRQFQVTLPDGTRVWLNAASSIRYPAAFIGKERKVEISGEVYFEVAEKKGMPFRVDVAGKATVDVLGTYFNVNAYENETDIHTTLLKGSVRVKAASSVVLQPGQQAKVNREANITVLKNIDISKIMAWKNGLFNFNGASLPEIMRQLERWYDIEVVYPKGIPDITFGGEMSKDIPLSGLLIALEKAEVHFKLEGRKLTVLP